jgi:hypothetical protein
MAVPTIVGSVKKVDNTAYVGKLMFYRMAPAMFNGTSFVVLSSLTVTTDAAGAFSTALHPGIYDIETAVSRYPGIPWSRVRVRVPNTTGTINLDDLELETALQDPSFFGGSSGGSAGATATNTTLGIVQLDQSDSTAVVLTKKTITGTDEKMVLFRPINGSIWVKSASTLLYYRLAVGVFGGTAQLGVESIGVEFEDLPVA